MIWIIILRLYDGAVRLVGVQTIREVFDMGHTLALRIRYNPATRLVTLRLPLNTRRDQVFGAVDSLSDDERLRLYNLPQHPIVER